MGGRKGGRKRLPTKLHLLQGGSKKTHRPMPVGEPIPPAIIPKCPKHLDKEARKEWRRKVKELEPLGMLTNLDGGILASWCHYWSIWVFASEKVREKGMVVMAKTGTPIFNPYYAIMNKANELMIKAGVEIGLTPSSRSRVKAEPRPKKNEADDFLKEGRK